MNVNMNMIGHDLNTSTRAQGGRDADADARMKTMRLDVE